MYIKTRQVKNFNEEIFPRDLTNINWQDVLYSSPDMNEMALKLTKLQSLNIDRRAPLRELSGQIFERTSLLFWLDDITNFHCFRTKIHCL